MTELEAIEIGRESILIMLKIAAPIMATALVVGLAIALFQALTSIQEMTLTFVPKIVVMFFSVLLFLPFILSTLTGFTHFIFDRIIASG